MNNEIMLSLDEIGLLPSGTPTSIDSRAQINPFINDVKNVKTSCKNRLPVFVSPMTSVLTEQNMKYFEDAGFTPILPRRNDNFDERIETCQTKWVAFSLQEFRRIVDENIASTKQHMYILVDIANGHIGDLYEKVSLLKQHHKNTTIMIGNIAHPDMYKYCCDAGVDYVRIGIGGGSVCSTSVQCGVHASHVWMIEQINKIKKWMDNPTTRIIADGGINTFDRAIKCLALGYDYVMLGKLCAQTAQACGEKRTHIVTCDGQDIYLNFDAINLGRKDWQSNIYGQFKEAYVERKYYGMASEQGQIDISGGANKNPEGVETWVKIEFTVDELRAKLEAALRSTMSYIDAINLQELRDYTIYRRMSISEFKSYYK